MAGLTREQRAARAAVRDAEAAVMGDAGPKIYDPREDDARPAAKRPALVRMVRDADMYPKPHTADVHPDEEANYALGGWVRA